ncbi:ABC transporter ATP-binding protein [Agaribacterium haliotis]|uniref:ABC transporter ATP-binding protein n=1 Tax=Agaribacterium haliotis TaxID=2013869 RepID=UPI00130461ED|nr:ABC transporter ATP-binding protein [Agaribacterium haliotis]
MAAQQDLSLNEKCSRYGAAQSIASVISLNKKFGENVALSDISFDIQAGQVLAVLGANGAGKTTLLKIFLGQLQADSGAVRFGAYQPGDAGMKQQCGAMLQVAALPDNLKVKEHIELFSSYYYQTLPYSELIAYAGLEHLQHRYTKSLSGGEKQRLLFALSICGAPKILFLDEPSVAMDIDARQGLWAAISALKQRGTAVVLTTHYLEEADALADELLFLQEGKVAYSASIEQAKSQLGSSLIRFIDTGTSLDFLSVPGVVNVTREGPFTELHSKQVCETLRALLQHQLPLEQLSVRRPSLEQVFNYLSKKENGVLPLVDRGAAA